MMDEVGDSKAEDSQPQRALWMRPLPTPAPAATPTAVAPAVPTELIAVGTAACFAARGRPSRGTAAEEKGGGLSTRFFTVLVSVIGFVGPLRLLLLEFVRGIGQLLYSFVW